MTRRRNAWWTGMLLTMLLPLAAQEPAPAPAEKSPPPAPAPVSPPATAETPSDKTPPPPKPDEPKVDDKDRLSIDNSLSFPVDI